MPFFCLFADTPIDGSLSSTLFFILYIVLLTLFSLFLILYIVLLLFYNDGFPYKQSTTGIRVSNYSSAFRRISTGTIDSYFPKDIADTKSTPFKIHFFLTRKNRKIKQVDFVSFCLQKSCEENIRILRDWEY